MHADTVVALVSTIAAAIIALVVPAMTFRFALRQDQARWLREQRAQLYVELLAEAYAEQQYLTWVMTDDETRERTREYFKSTDVRLPPLDRARLGARATAFASQDVNQLFNQLEGAGGRALLKPQPGEGDQLILRVQVGGLLDKLQAQVRKELGADTIALDGPPPSSGRTDEAETS